MCNAGSNRVWQVLDQHVLLGGKPHLLGTDVAAELRAAGFVGVTCIVTGADQVRVEPRPCRTSKRTPCLCEPV